MPRKMQTTHDGKERLTRCDNCGRVWPENKLNEPDDLWERLDAGSEVPAGECPDEDCGALCYLVDT